MSALRVGTETDTVADPLALASNESIMLDGANAVAGDPRQHFPRAPLSLGLSTLVLVLAVVLLRRGRGVVLAAALAVAAVPGLLVVLTVRADAPARRPELTSAIQHTLGDLQSRVPWPGVPFTVVHEEDDVLFPLARYALPSRPTPQGPGVELEVWGGRLGQPCGVEPESGHVVCGARP